MNYIYTLPNEIIDYILVFTDYSTLSVVYNTDKKLRNIVNSIILSKIKRINHSNNDCNTFKYSMDCIEYIKNDIYIQKTLYRNPVIKNIIIFGYINLFTSVYNNSNTIFNVSVLKLAISHNRLNIVVFLHSKNIRFKNFKVLFNNLPKRIHIHVLEYLLYYYDFYNDDDLNWVLNKSITKNFSIAIIRYLYSIQSPLYKTLLYIFQYKRSSIINEHTEAICFFNSQLACQKIKYKN